MPLSYHHPSLSYSRSRWPLTSRTKTPIIENNVPAIIVHLSRTITRGDSKKNTKTLIALPLVSYRSKRRSVINSPREAETELLSLSNRS